MSDRGVLGILSGDLLWFQLYFGFSSVSDVLTSLLVLRQQDAGLHVLVC